MAEHFVHKRDCVLGLHLSTKTPCPLAIDPSSRSKSFTCIMQFEILTYSSTRQRSG